MSMKTSSIQRYPEQTPKINDYVMVMIEDFDSDVGAHFVCLEYPQKRGLIGISDMTRQKRVRSYRKLCPAHSLKVVQITDISDTTGELQASLKTVESEDDKIVSDRYNLNTRLIKVLQKFCRDQKYDDNLQEVYQSLVWPIITSSDGDASSEHPFYTLSNPDYLNQHMSSSPYIPEFEKRLTCYFGDIHYETTTLFTVMFNGYDGLGAITEMLEKFENLEIDTAPNYKLSLNGDNREDLIKRTALVCSAIENYVNGIQSSQLSRKDTIVNSRLKK